MSNDTKKECPDTGTCHHRCSVGCFRVEYCGPLSIANFPDDRWPDEIKARFTPSDGML